MADTTCQAGGSEHRPVLCRETLAALAVQPDDVVVDCTFGRGGHSRAILDRLGPQGGLLALDRDPDAIAAGQGLAASDARLRLVRARFGELRAVLDAQAMRGPVDAVLFDLGVSSPQLDDAARGFSFRTDGPLDMRMDPQQGPSAAEWLAEVPEQELADTLYALGEERLSRRIARRVVERRQRQPFLRTLDLADTVAACYRRREPGKHPATRTFQAIRMYLNDELGELERGLRQALDVLAGGGRLVVISFHSLEDRLVKRFLREHSQMPRADAGPRGLPPPPGTPEPLLEHVARAIKAGAEELARNPRARSAVLRSARRREALSGVRA